MSARISASGPPGRIVELLRDRRFELVTSNALLDELGRVLQRPHILALTHSTPAEAKDLIHLLQGLATVVEPKVVLHVVERDPADDRVLEAAVAADADFIVSGDRELLAIGEYNGIPIVTPRRFVSVLTGDE